MAVRKIIGVLADLLLLRMIVARRAWRLATPCDDASDGVFDLPFERLDNLVVHRLVPTI
jgi:hypothetical protein